MAAIDLSRETFASGDYVARFAAQVGAAVGSANSPGSILDIGCGNGELLCALAAQFPDARLTGIDLSDANIALARGQSAKERLAPTPQLIAADYRRQSFQRFDLIVSYSTLHLIETPTEELVDKLSRELAEGGSLVVTVPVQGAYNRGLMIVRRLARLMRSAAMDKMVLALASAASGHLLDRRQLAQRVHYMYLIPNFLWNDETRRLFKSRGMVVLGEWPEPHVSLAQPKHVRVHLRRTTG